jgi:hypothetical protein
MFILEVFDSGVILKIENMVLRSPFKVKIKDLKNLNVYTKSLKEKKVSFKTYEESSTEKSKHEKANINLTPPQKSPVTVTERNINVPEKNIIPSVIKSLNRYKYVDSRDAKIKDPIVKRPIKKIRESITKKDISRTNISYERKIEDVVGEVLDISIDYNILEQNKTNIIEDNDKKYNIMKDEIEEVRIVDLSEMAKKILFEFEGF